MEGLTEVRGAYLRCRPGPDYWFIRPCPCNTHVQWDLCSLCSSHLLQQGDCFRDSHVPGVLDVEIDQRMEPLAEVCEDNIERSCREPVLLGKGEGAGLPEP